MVMIATKFFFNKRPMGPNPTPTPTPHAKNTLMCFDQILYKGWDEWTQDTTMFYVNDLFPPRWPACDIPSGDVYEWRDDWSQ